MIGRRDALLLIAPLALVLAGFFLVPVLMLLPTTAAAAARPGATGGARLTRRPLA